ncbi:MAG: hypothetical protein A2166_06715 [Omnitrophica WOR_2 bacterium RBG_13_41_10]|nr:MAG: hypothetical protein A2166_06715 [Omnitrophica WOR_2 bacterium RBG_13_41_10]
MSNKLEKCGICGCIVHRRGHYAEPTIEGRSHATRHHYVAERFFGRSKNRKNTQREGVFKKCPWNQEKQSTVFCYECHEELIHNPVFLPEDIKLFAELVESRNLNEHGKRKGKEKIAGRIQLLHEIIATGLKSLKKE